MALRRFIRGAGRGIDERPPAAGPTASPTGPEVFGGRMYDAIQRAGLEWEYALDCSASPCVAIVAGALDPQDVMAVQAELEEEDDYKDRTYSLQLTHVKIDGVDGKFAVFLVDEDLPSRDPTEFLPIHPRVDELVDDLQAEASTEPPALGGDR